MVANGTAGNGATELQRLLDTRLRYMLWSGLSAHGNSWGECVKWKGDPSKGKMFDLGRSKVRQLKLTGPLWYGLSLDWYITSGWQERSKALFEAAASVSQ